MNNLTQHVPPTAEELQRWKQMSEAATPRPWMPSKIKYFEHLIHARDGKCAELECIASFNDVVERKIRIENTELACESRNALPRLIAEVERLRKPVLRCKACDGVLMGKYVDDEIIVYHNCTPKDVRERFEKMLAALERLSVIGRSSHDSDDIYSHVEQIAKEALNAK